MSRNKLNTTIGSTIAIYVGLALFLIFMMLPFYVIIANSITFENEMDAVAQFVALPEKLNFSTFVEIFAGAENVLQEETSIFYNVPMLLVGLWNTFWQVIPKTVVSLVVSGLAGYAYCKLKFKGKDVLFGLQLATMMIPTACLTVPIYLYYDALGWTNSVLPLIIPGLFGGTSTIFFMKQFFESIPTEIIEAARIDGLGEISIFFKIIFPLAMPAFISQFILIFIGGYNAYLGPLIYLGGLKEYYPLQLVIENIFGILGGNASLYASKALCSIVPLAIIYLIGQKFFIGGITSGAVKG